MYESNFSTDVTLINIFVTGVEAARDSSCPRICPQTGGGDPVCGSDSVIYRNLCELKKKTCGKGKPILPLKKEEKILGLDKE